MKNNKVKLLYFMLYVFGAISTTQMIPFLKSENFNEQQSGFILSSIAIFCVLFHILFGLLADKNGKIKIYFVFIIILNTCLCINKVHCKAMVLKKKNAFSISTS